MTSPNESSLAPRPKRRFLRWVLVGLALCLLVVALAPTLLAPTVVRKVVAAVDEELPGSVRVEDASLGWLSDTRFSGCELFDPEGGRVARCDVEAPSLLRLVGGLGRRFGTVRVTASAEFVADEAGVTNLDRALGSGGGDEAADAAERDPGAGAELPTGRIELVVERATWSDPSTRERGVTVGVADVRGVLEVREGATVDLDLEGEVLGAEGGRLSVDAEVRDPLAPLDGPVPPSFRAQVRIAGLASGLVDSIAGAEGLVRDVLGPTLALDVDAEGSTKSGWFTTRVAAPNLDVTGALAVADGVLGAREGADVLRAELRSVGVVLERFADALPAGASASIAPGGVASLGVTSMALPLEVLLRERGEDEDLVGDLLAALSTTFEATLPELRYLHPVEGGSPAEVDVAGARVAATLTAGAPLEGSVRAEVGGAGAAQRGTLDATFRHPEPARALAEPPVPAPFTATLAKFPTALVDALAGQDGLIADALGPELSGDVNGTWPLEAAPIEADFRSASGSFRVTARMEDGVLRAGDGGVVDARIGLTPLVSERIVGNLLPHLVQLQQQDASERVALTVADFTLPLDGDLTQLAADVTLDLGAVRYQLLPGLDRLLALAGKGSSTWTTRFERLHLRVAGGKVAYERLPLSIDGVAYPLAGTFDLAERAFDLETELPLSLLGKDVTGVLGKATSVLGGDTLVPLELKGSVTRPRFTIPSDFVERALKGAGSDLLERGLRGILGGK